MPIELTQDGTMLQHQDGLLPQPSVLEIVQRGREIDGLYPLNK
jgi:hypothetical protein